jgi:hypothetical protein
MERRSVAADGAGAVGLWCCERARRVITPARLERAAVGNGGGVEQDEVRSIVVGEAKPRSALPAAGDWSTATLGSFCGRRGATGGDGCPRAVSDGVSLVSAHRSVTVRTAMRLNRSTAVNRSTNIALSVTTPFDGNDLRGSWLRGGREGSRGCGLIPAASTVACKTRRRNGPATGPFR